MPSKPGALPIFSFSKAFSTSRIAVVRTPCFILLLFYFYFSFIAVVRAALDNSLCTLFANDAHRQLHNIFKQSGTNIKTVRQLRNAIYVKFFDNP